MLFDGRKITVGWFFVSYQKDVGYITEKIVSFSIFNNKTFFGQWRSYLRCGSSRVCNRIFDEKRILQSILIFSSVRQGMGVRAKLRHEI